MSKKLLASLIALTMVSAYACDDGDGGDKGNNNKPVGEACEGNTKVCDGDANIKICNKGELKSYSCAEYAQPGYVCRNNECVPPNSGSCTHGDTQCSGTLVQQCLNGTWTTAEDCATNGNVCVFDQVAVCQPSGTPSGKCTDGAYQCAGKELQKCSNNAWSTEKTCTAEQRCDAAQKDCVANVNPPAGDNCTDTSTSQCTNNCVSDVLGYFWDSNNSIVKSVNCTGDEKCNVALDGYTTCGVKCTAESTGSCIQACKADGSEGYYWNNSTSSIVTKTCANNDCYLYLNDAGRERVGCRSEGGSTPTTCDNPVTTGGEEGACCEASSYQVSCINEGANALVCAKGAVKKWTCKDSQCSVADNKVTCPNPTGSTGDLPDNIPATCTKGQSKGLCGSDGMPYICGDSGYYKGKCESGSCYECGDGKWVACGATEAAACAGHETPSTGTTCTGDVVTEGGAEGACCEASSYQVSCINNGANALVCAKGAVKQWTCKDSQCSVADNKVTCPNPSGSSSGDLPDNIPETCTKGSSKGLCGSDGMPYICGDSGYYKGKCESGTCFECGDGYWVACGADKATACAGHDTPAETCTYGSYEANCNGDVATYCAFGDKLKTTTCDAGKCTLCTDGYVGCDVDCTQDGHNVKCNGDTKLTTGGNDGDCCDVAKYVPKCSGNESVTYCSSVGKVKTKTCGSSCSVDSNNKYTCN